MSVLRRLRCGGRSFVVRWRSAAPPGSAIILDLYDDVEEIRSYGQTIVYSIHDTVGHLGIFVSSSVARKEHDEFSSNIDKHNYSSSLL